MTSEHEFEEDLLRLGKSLRHSPSIVPQVVRKIDTVAQERPGTRRPRRVWRDWRVATAAAAAFIACCFAGWALLGSKNGSSAWWLEPRDALAEEIGAALRDARLKGVRCHQTFVLQMRDGSKHTSSTTSVRYICGDRRCEEILDAGVLREIQLYIPGKDSWLFTGYRKDTRTFGINPAGPVRQADPVEELRKMVLRGFEDGRFLGKKSVEGKECVGFELQEIEPGREASGQSTVVWFGMAAKLPVRVEFSYPRPEDPSRRQFIILDRFDYAAKFAPERFVARIPAGYVEAHPDDIKPREGAPRRTDDEVNKKLATAVPNRKLEREALGPTLANLGQLAGVEVRPIWKALERRGLKRDTEVSCTFDGATVATALTEVLASVDASEELGYVIREGNVIVSRVTRSELVIRPVKASRRP